MIHLYHYYEKRVGPFKSLTQLEDNEAEAILKKLRLENKTFAARRSQQYLEHRREIERKVKELFIQKGGKPITSTPHYFVYEPCPWLLEWFEDGKEIRIPLSFFNPSAISFTYGDSFPAMKVQDEKPYRGHVYTFAEIEGLITKFGLPQLWNADGKLGPERYIEVQVWDDNHLNKSIWEE